jgi:transcriptional regulator with GAF, ATPase, and Fis domain
MARRKLSLFTPGDLDLARSIGALAETNPFTEARVAIERRVLGDDFAPHRVWSRQDHASVNGNTARIGERVVALLDRAVERAQRGARASPNEEAVYRDVVLYGAFHQLEPELYDSVKQAESAGSTVDATYFDEFQAELDRRLTAVGLTPPSTAEAAHLFAGMFQVHRAFHHVFHRIIGNSRPTAALRASIWQSIFTHDLRRYLRTVYSRLGDLPTLVTGPSGSGKDLVARAIALSRYVPFDPKRKAFVGEISQAYFPLNVAALPSTLIESELFGHRRGAFTGALEDRTGWLEACPELGTVFLDEIGELGLELQVKLLRVLQERSFQRVGETRTRHFRGKVVAATNQDLAALIASGRFREDLYYRLRADLVETPTLAERVADSPDELPTLVRFIAERVAGSDEAEALATETLDWIRRVLGSTYPWPGNVRELEQCVRNVLVRGEYHPQGRRIASPVKALEAALRTGSLSAEQLVTRYAGLVYTQTGSYVETARRLGLDRRTVAKHVAGSKRESE